MDSAIVGKEFVSPGPIIETYKFRMSSTTVSGCLLGIHLATGRRVAWSIK